MKTTIDIPDEDLDEVISHTDAKTKREAILEAVRYYNRVQRLRELSEMLGTFEDFISQEDLKRMREGVSSPESLTIIGAPAAPRRGVRQVPNAPAGGGGEMR